MFSGKKIAAAFTLLISKYPTIVMSAIHNKTIGNLLLQTFILLYPGKRGLAFTHISSLNCPADRDVMYAEGVESGTGCPLFFH